MMVQTEIGLLPEDWEVVRLEEQCTTSSGGTPSRENPNFYVGRIKWYTTSELRDSMLYDSIEHISQEAINCSSAKVFPKGTLLMAMYGATIGKLGILCTEAATNQACCAITSKQLNLRYLYFYLLNNRNSIISLGTGAGQPNISQAIVKQLQIPVPPQSEQQNIATALSSIDKLIDDLGRTIQKKQRIREGAMEELLSGKKRLPGFTEEWVEKKIGDIGKTYSGLTGKTKEDFGHGDAKYITFLNVLNNAILDISIFEAVDVRPNEKQNAAHYGDLFFNTSSETPEDVGTCACLNTEVPNLYLNSFCFGYRLNDEEVYGNFLAYFFRTKAGRDIMYSLAQGATRYNLSKEYFNEIKITMPPTIKEQQSISYVFEAMTDEISLLESERAKYEQIRSGMMEELLTGKKRLK